MKHLKRSLFILVPVCILLALLLVWRARRLPAYLSDHFIVHACGAIDGNRYTNSVEALERTLEENPGVVEVDFSYTSDGALVCNHAWKDFERTAPTLETFLSTPTIGGFTPMTAEMALQKLVSHGETYLVVDTQEENVISVYERIIEICTSLENGSSYLEKIVPQIYSQEEYTEIRNLFSFPEWIFTLYKMDMDTIDQYKAVAEFSRDHGIKVITMSYKRASREVIDMIHRYGRFVAVHTVNTEENQKQFFADGVDVIYTDNNAKKIPAD